jgi:hypothetical protein
MLKENSYLPTHRFSCYFFFLIAGVTYAITASFVVGHYEHFFDSSIYSYSYGFGPTTKALVENGSCRTFANGIAYTMHRYPLIPYFLYVIHFFTTNAFMALVIKNIFTGVLFSYATYRAYITWGKNAVILLLIVFCSPQFLIHAFNIYHEEAFVSVLLALISILLCTPQSSRKISWDDFFFGISCVLFIFTKSSSIYLASILPLLWFFQRKSYSALLVSAGSVISAFITIAVYSFMLNGTFTLESSLNGVNIYKGNNSKTFEIYPKYNLDILDKTDSVIKSPGVFKNEWEYNRSYKNKAYSYIIHHPRQFLKGVFIKTWALFFSIHPIGTSPEREKKNNIVLAIDLLITIFQRGLFCMTCFVAFILIFFRSPIKQKYVALIVFLFILLYSGPFLIGFSYMRHYVPLMFPVIVFGMKLYSCKFPANQLFSNKTFCKSNEV